LWLRDLERRSVVYANLLVPGDPEATWQHQRRLETWGLCPVPVVEVAQDHRVLGRYLEAGYRYIALSAPPGHARPAGTLTPPCPGCVVGSRWPALGLAFTCWRPRAGRWWRRCPGTPRMSTGGLMPWEARSWCGSTPGRVAFGGWQWAGRIGGNSWASTAPTRALSAYERRAVLAGLIAEAWQAAETWLGNEFGPVTIADSHRAGPRLYLDSLGGVQLAHRGFANLAAALGDLQPRPDGGSDGY
jgi:hypothetical protein